MLICGDSENSYSFELFTMIGLFCTCAHPPDGVKGQYGMQAVKTVNDMIKREVKQKENR